MKKIFSFGYKSLFLYISAFGFAITLLSSLEPLLQLSKISKLLLSHWKEIITTFWNKVFSFLNIDLSLEIAEALTASIFFLLLGFFSNKYVLEKIKNIPLVIHSHLNIKFSYLFNILFLLFFSIINLTNFYKSNIDVSSFLEILKWSSPLLILSYSLFIISVKISIAPLLRKKITISLVILFTIISLDKLYVPLEKFLLQITN